MPEIVTLAEAKLFCRVMHDDEDAVFMTLIAAATEAVKDIATNWNESEPIPARLKLAALTRIAGSYENRETIGVSKGEHAMLQPLRKLEV